MSFGIHILKLFSMMQLQSQYAARESRTSPIIRLNFPKLNRVCIYLIEKTLSGEPTGWEDGRMTGWDSGKKHC